MYIVCPACTKRLQIPDNKLPTDHAVRITCPSCQERFSYDPRTQRAAGNGGGYDAPVSPPMGAAALPARLVDPDALRALICLDSPAYQETCQQALQSLGYTANVMPNQFKAIEYLRQVPYRLFVLDAGFDGTTLDTNLVLTFLRERPLEQRRYQFVALCAPDVVTADPMTAYSQNVNLVINHEDMPQCAQVLVQHLGEHELLYRTFREMRQQLGKEV